MRITALLVRGPANAVLAAALALSLSLPGCASSPPGAPHPGAKKSGPVSPSPATSGLAVTNEPFKVVASYGATSLGLSKPANLAVGPDGNLYITDAGQHVSVVTPDGKMLRRWGGRGKAPGEFSFVKHNDSDDVPNVSAPIVVAPDGTVYVADTGNARIQAFTVQGTFLRQFGRFGKGPDEWLMPTELAVDPDGSLYVFDDPGLALWKLSASGVRDWTIRSSSTTDEDLAGHLHLAGVDDHHRLVAAVDDTYHLIYLDRRGHKVDVVDLRGVGGIQESAYYAGPCGSSLGPDATVYISSCQEPLQPPHDLTVVNRAHQLAAVWLQSPLGWSPNSESTVTSSAFATPTAPSSSSVPPWPGGDDVEPSARDRSGPDGGVHPGRGGGCTAAAPADKAGGAPSPTPARYVTKALIVPLEVTAPSWIGPTEVTENAHFLTWVPTAGQRPAAVRFLVPLNVYPPGRHTAARVPDDYLGYLLSLEKYGAHFADQSRIDIDGHSATLFTLTADQQHNGAIGCYVEDQPAGECAGLQIPLSLRMVVLTVDGYNLVVWLRVPIDIAPADARASTASFEEMLRGIRLRSGAPPSSSPTR